MPRLPNTHACLQHGLGFILADARGPALEFLSLAGDLQESWCCASARVVRGRAGAVHPAHHKLQGSRVPPCCRGPFSITATSTLTPVP